MMRHCEHVRWAHLLVDTNDRVAHAFVLELIRAVGRTPVILDHPEHRLCVLSVLRKRANHASHFSGRCIRVAGKDRRQSSSDRSALFRVVCDSHPHEDRAEVRITEAKRPIVVRALSDLLGWELRHRDRDLKHHRPDPDCILVASEIEFSCCVVVELPKVQRCEVARRVVEEHVFRAGVRCPDLSASGGRVPLVDR